MANSYDVGDLIRLSITFKVGSTPTDPTTITFRILSPDGTVTEYIYATDDELVRDSDGVYHVDWIPDVKGVWAYRWEATGAVIEAEQAKFNVRPAEPAAVTP
jgi:hypothetical protein